MAPIAAWIVCLGPSGAEHRLHLPLQASLPQSALTKTQGAPSIAVDADPLDKNKTNAVKQIVRFRVHISKSSTKGPYGL